MDIVYLVIGLLGGTGAAVFVMAQKEKNIKSILEQQLAQLKTDAQQKDRMLDEKNQQIIELNKTNAQLKTASSSLEEKLQVQKMELEEIHQKLSLEFKNLANEIFEEKSKKFTQQNKENLHLILNPLSDKIKDFQKKVEVSIH